MPELEIIPAVTEIVVSLTVIGSLVFMTMIFAVLTGQLMYGLFDG